MNRLYHWTPRVLEVAAQLRQALKPVTFEARAERWRRFENVCVANREPALPASADTVVRYLEQLPPGSRREALSAITAFHGATEGAALLQDGKIRAALRREGAASVKKRRPLEHEHLKQLLAALGTGPSAQQARALLLAGYYFGLTCAQLLALDREQLSVTERGLELQAAGAAGSPRVAPRSEDTATDLDALKEWLRLPPLKGPLFANVRPDQRPDRIDDMTLKDRFERLLKAAGLAGEGYSLASLAVAYRRRVAKALKSDSQRGRQLLGAILYDTFERQLANGSRRTREPPLSTQDPVEVLGRGTIELKVWERFAAWCQQNGQTALPANEEMVLAYLRQGEEVGKQHRTLQGWLSVLGRVHRAAGHPSVVSYAGVQALMAQRRLQGAGPPKPLRAVTLSELGQLLATTSQDTQGLRDRALAAALFCNLSLSEVAATGRDQVRFTRRDTAILTVPSGRTHEFFPAADARRCPVEALRAWRDVLRAQKVRDGPFFRVVRDSGLAPLSPRSVSRVLMRAATRAGLGHLTPDSLRLGYCVHVASLSESTAQVQTELGVDKLTADGYLLRAAELELPLPEALRAALTHRLGEEPRAAPLTAVFLVGSPGGSSLEEVEELARELESGRVRATEIALPAAAQLTQADEERLQSLRPYARSAAPDVRELERLAGTWLNHHRDGLFENAGALRYPSGGVANLADRSGRLKVECGPVRAEPVLDALRFALSVLIVPRPSDALGAAPRGFLFERTAMGTMQRERREAWPEPSSVD